MKRSEQLVENTWNITDLFENEEAWNNELQRVEEMTCSLQAFHGSLHQPSSLVAFLDLYFDMEKRLEDCIDYASLQSDQDSANAYFQNMKGKVITLTSKIDSSLSFMAPEILQLSKNEYEELFKQEPKLEKYSRYLDDIIRKKDHMLDPTQEKILALAQETCQAPEVIFHILNDADVRFADASDALGGLHPVTSASYFDHIANEDRVLRKNAFQSMYDSYEKIANTTAALLNAQCKQLKFQSDIRGYASSVEASLDQTNVPVSVYKNLIEAVHEDLPILHKYMKVRKKHLHLDQVHMYDLYTSLVPACDKPISFTQAKEDVLDSIQIFGKEYVDIYKQGLNSRWIDIYENEGKRSGAYSNGANVHPYVLLNHTPTLHSEFTLAHEMGHAMHSYLSNHYQPYCDSKYKIFVAEVASTCNEALLMHKLQYECKDPLEKAYLINYFMEQFRTTLYRQCMLAEFEWKINEKVAQGNTLSAELLCSIYHDLNELYYGPDCVIDTGIDFEWAKIPHLYYNFYLYQYATGFSAAMALSQKIIHGTQDDIDAYLTFLKGGCSKTPIELLRQAGVDMTTAKPIHDALSLFDSLIDEFDEILSNI